MLELCTLASGSSGNAALVSCGDTHVLLDAGISARRITTGLKSLGVDPADLSAILITHEHQDHVSGLAVLTKKIRPPIYATPATCGQLADQLPHGAELLQSRLPGAGFAVGELWIEPFATPHDAAGSVGYVLSGGGRTMALCTDLGYVTDQVRQAVAGCDLLVCETNYDPDWMRTGPYPLCPEAAHHGRPRPPVQPGRGGVGCHGGAVRGQRHRLGPPVGGEQHPRPGAGDGEPPPAGHGL